MRIKITLILYFLTKIQLSNLTLLLTPAESEEEIPGWSEWALWAPFSHNTKSLFYHSGFPLMYFRRWCSFSYFLSVRQLILAYFSGQIGCLPDWELNCIYPVQHKGTEDSLFFIHQKNKKTKKTWKPNKNFVLVPLIKALSGNTLSFQRELIFYKYIII